MATRHEIKTRNREFEAAPASMGQFELAEGTPISLGELASNPAWTLYTVDVPGNQALFLRIPDGTDLAASGFSYPTQFTEAIEAALVPFHEMKAIADGVPQPRRLVHLFSTGRCGSTLASRIFGQLDNVWSLSEPDTFTILANIPHLRGTRELRDLLNACLKITYKPVTENPENSCVLKYRSEATYFAEDMVAATPDSASIYLYREPLGFTKSIYRFAARQGVDLSPGPKEKFAFFWDFLGGGTDWNDIADFVDPESDQIGFADFQSVLWCHRIENYLSARAHGNEFAELSYDQLNRDRENSVRKLLETIGAATPTNITRAMEAYKKDAQAGTAGANSNDVGELPQDQLDRLISFTQNNPRMMAAMTAMGI